MPPSCCSASWNGTMSGVSTHLVDVVCVPGCIPMGTWHTHYRGSHRPTARCPPCKREIRVRIPVDPPAWPCRLAAGCPALNRAIRGQHPSGLPGTEQRQRTNRALACELFCVACPLFWLERCGATAARRLHNPQAGGSTSPIATNASQVLLAARLVRAEQGSVRCRWEAPNQF